MNTIKLFLILCLSASCGVAWAQTNMPAQNTNATNRPQQEVAIDSDGSYFDGILYQLVYTNHVFVTDHEKVWLHCERLTVDVPQKGGNPTNIVAETNVVIDLLNGGETNHITCEKAVYAYHLSDPVTNVINAITNVVYATTNETITFTGGNPMPKVESPQLIAMGEKLILDVPTKKFSGMTKTDFKPRQGSGNGTNTTPFNLLK